MAQASFVYALFDDGALYSRPCGPKAPPDCRWAWVADLGDRHFCVVHDCGYLYGINASLDVDWQPWRGARSDGWTRLSRGTVVSITADSGTVYGIGGAEGGDKVYRLARPGGTDDDYGGKSWVRASKGTSTVVAIQGGQLYTLGVNFWVYKQPLEGLTETSDWKKAFNVFQPCSALAVFEGDSAFAICDDTLWRRDPGWEGRWHQENRPGLPANRPITVFSGPEAPQPAAERGTKVARQSANAEPQVIASSVTAQPAAPARDQPEALEKLDNLTVRQLKCRMANAGLKLRPGADKEEMVAQLRAVENANPQENGADEVGAAPTAEVLSKLSVKELKRRIQEAGAVVPVGTTEKNELVQLLLTTALPAAPRSRREPTDVSSVRSSPSAPARSSVSFAPPAATQNAVSSSSFAVGSTVVATSSAASLGAGYLTLTVGERIEVLHAGSTHTGDSGWLFGRRADCNEQGWLQCANVAPSSQASSPSSQASAPSSQTPAPSSHSPATNSQAPAPSSQAPAPSSQAPAPSSQATAGAWASWRGSKSEAKESVHQPTANRPVPQNLQNPVDPGAIFPKGDRNDELVVDFRGRKVPDDIVDRIVKCLSPPLVRLAILDLSECNIEDRFTNVLMLALHRECVQVKKLMLHKNCICDGAKSIAKYLHKASFPVHELHLSHNRIRNDGAISILRAIAGHTAYPRRCEGRPIPFFLRLEHNQEVIFSQRDAEAVVRQERERADLKVGWNAQDFLVCCAGKSTCSADYCGWAAKDGVGPIIHLPFLESRRGRRSPVPTSAPTPTPARARPSQTIAADAGARGYVREVPPANATPLPAVALGICAPRVGNATVIAPVASAGEGFLELSTGATVFVEYVGVGGDETGWLYGYDVGTSKRGWFSAQAVRSS